MYASTYLTAARDTALRFAVQPDGDQARQWAQDELAQTVYQEAKPSWLDQLLAAALDWITSLLSGLRGVNANLGLVLVLLAAAVVIGIAIWRLKPRTNRSQPVRNELFDAGAERSAAQHRDAAKRAADSGRWAEAVLEQFRAIVRSAEERTVLEVRPGQTATEVTGQLQAAFESLAPALSDAGLLFNGVRYGGTTPQQADFDALARLDLELRRHRPEYDRGAGGSLVSPR